MPQKLIADILLSYTASRQSNNPVHEDFGPTPPTEVLGSSANKFRNQLSRKAYRFPIPLPRV